MEIRGFLQMLYRRLPVIFVVPVLAMAVVTVAGFLIPPIYTAQSTVRVLWDVGLYDISPRKDVTDRLVTTYGEMVKSPPVLEEAIRRVSGGKPWMSAADLADRVSIEMNPDSEFMTIAVQDLSSARARDLANELSTLLIAYAQTYAIGYESSGDQLLHKQALDLKNELLEEYQALATASVEDDDSPVARGISRQISVKEDVYRRVLDRAELVGSYEALRANSVKLITPATLPRKPINSLGRQELLLALVIGLCGGIGLALFLESVDTRIRTPQQAEQVGKLPILGDVPPGLLSPAGAAAAAQEHQSQQLEESYRLLAAGLLAVLEDAADRSLVFTSTSPPEDGAEVVSSLAPILAQAGNSVLLVDANLHKPRLHMGFGLRNLVGLCNTLDGQVSLHEAVQDASGDGRVSVLTTGPVPENPLVLLSSPNMALLIDAAQQTYDIVLLNTASILAEPTAAVLARLADKIVLVLHRMSSTEAQLGSALQQLRTAGGDPLGLIIVHKGTSRRNPG